MTLPDAELPPRPASMMPPQAPERRRRQTGTSRRNGIAPIRMTRPPRSTMIALAMVIVALVLGGGGTPDPAMEMVVEVVEAALIITACMIGVHATTPVRVPATAWAIGLPALLMPLIQLIPLPPMLWRALPGRETERAMLDLTGSGNAWMPLSIAPPVTFSALLAMLVPLTILIMVARLDLRGRTTVLIGVVAIGLMSIVLGAMQLSQFAGASWSLHPSYNVGWLVGFQANRNAEADILLIAMLATAAIGLMPFERRDIGKVKLPLIAGSMAMLGIGVVMTGSRAGIGLLLVTAAFAVAILWPRLRHRTQFLWRWLIGALAMGVIGGFALTRLTAIQTVVGRFGNDTEGRWDFWIDTVYALRKVWPAGTGIGTFQIAYKPAERLETVAITFPNRAHDDWLEWTLETGAMGWVAVAVTVLALVWSVRLAWRQTGADPVQRGQILFGIGVLVIEALHAIVDYPTRAISLAALIAVGSALITPIGRSASVQAGRRTAN